MLYMLQVVLPEALEPQKHQVGRVGADHTVSGVHNGLRSLFQGIQSPQGGLAIEDLLHQAGELSQADTAGHALAAGLGVAQIKEVERHIHRAQARRAGGDPPLHGTVQALHDGLSLAGCFDFESAQRCDLLSSEQKSAKIQTRKSDGPEE